MTDPGYTLEEIKLLLPRIPYLWMREYIGELLRNKDLRTIEERHLMVHTTTYEYLYLTPYENLPLLINNSISEFGRTLIKWRLGIGK